MKMDAWFFRTLSIEYFGASSLLSKQTTIPARNRAAQPDQCQQAQADGGRWVVAVERRRRSRVPDLRRGLGCGSGISRMLVQEPVQVSEAAPDKGGASEDGRYKVMTQLDVFLSSKR